MIALIFWIAVVCIEVATIICVAPLVFGHRTVRPFDYRETKAYKRDAELAAIIGGRTDKDAALVRGVLLRKWGPLMPELWAGGEGAY